ncbi:ribosome biogenesis GTPase YqeH [Paenibacillus sp. P26]|nr:ribosome biogenesis GTPase YqeH [Paenibacillus sp. P26]
MKLQQDGSWEALRCAGRGVALQTESAERLGYVPEKALSRTPVICQRCFRIKNYNDAAGYTLDQDDFLRSLNHVGSTDSLVVNIVDLFDFEGSMIAGLPRFVGNNPVVLVVNKIDLLPKVTNFNRIVNWVQRQAKEAGLRVVEVVLCSAKKNMGFERVLEVLDEYRDGKDIYVVGATNVGKSTLINRLIRDYSDLDAELTTSQYPGTTLDLVRIPLDDGSFIIDTPGIVYKHRLTELIDKKDLPKVMPDKPIKPLIYQLNERQTIFFGDLARFDFVQGSVNRLRFTCRMRCLRIGPSWSGRMSCTKSIRENCSPRRPARTWNSCRSWRSIPSGYRRAGRWMCPSPGLAGSKSTARPERIW